MINALPLLAISLGRPLAPNIYLWVKGRERVVFTGQRIFRISDLRTMGHGRACQDVSTAFQMGLWRGDA